MGAFLSVAQGSQEVPWLLELRLNMAEGEPEDNEEGEEPIALVGKGVLSISKRAAFYRGLSINLLLNSTVSVPTLEIQGSISSV